MLIFWEERMVFLATPKTGSTAIAMALESLASVSIQRPATLKHTSLSAYRLHVGTWLEAQAGTTFTTVALMRDPVDWLRSWYRFRLRDDMDDPDHPMEDVSFEQFADIYASPDGPQQLGIRNQSDFLMQGTDKVDRIFRYENMDNFVNFLEDRLNFAIELPRANVPPEVNVDLSEKQEAKLRHAMATDLALYATLD